MTAISRVEFRHFTKARCHVPPQPAPGVRLYRAISPQLPTALCLVAPSLAFADVPPGGECGCSSERVSVPVTVLAISVLLIRTRR